MRNYLNNFPLIVVSQLLKYALLINFLLPIYLSDIHKKENKISVKGTFTLLILYMIILAIVWFTVYFLLINRGTII